MIWLMEGLSSQRGIIRGIKQWITQSSLNNTPNNLKVLASHRKFRPEITGEADLSLTEPVSDSDRMDFIFKTVEKQQVSLIHVGRHCSWYEAHRSTIESCGVVLITGASSETAFQIAADKYAFTQLLAVRRLPYTEAIKVETLEELTTAIQNMKGDYPDLCIKPNQGIYGIGYWRLDDEVSPHYMLQHPDDRRINTHTYLDAIEKSGGLQEPMIVMPYLPGSECSIDMVVEHGDVVAALGRRKNGPLQTLFTHGEEIDLARQCAALLQADGLVNVQTREDATGQPRILESNLRPSGGVTYGLAYGVNLPAIMVARRLGFIPPVADIAQATLRIIDHAVAIPQEDQHEKT